jgi:signal transduction histidine kinase
MIAQELPHAQIMFGVAVPDASTFQLPSWLKAHLERHPSLYKKLEQGELVGIHFADPDQGPRPATAARSDVFLFPVSAGTLLHGVIALISPTNGPQLVDEDFEIVRQIAQQAAAVLTPLLKLERLRRENSELQSLLRMRSHLQSNVAHELRTPLAAVRGYARMILDGRAGQVNDTQKEYLHVVDDNATRLINLVNWMTQILEMSTDDFELSRFDLRDVWSECIRARKFVTISEEIPNESFEMVGDRRKIARALDQLIAALGKVATAGSSIAVQFWHGREGGIQVKLSDNGAIVPPELLTRIFDRSFSSVPMPLAQKPERSDFDLSSIYDIIGMHGGRFFVNSKTGQGVTFLFSLPAVIWDGEEKLGHEQAVNSSR